MTPLAASIENSQEELVVLVDEHNTPLGTAPKSSVHHADTPLHRGFSIFLFDPSNQLLLQSRAPTKVTWPSFWSNSCCGHEAPGEDVVDAAKRRARYELGIEIEDVEVIVPDYRYRAEFAGIVENEFCPVLVGRCTNSPKPNRDEVGAIRWTDWTSFSDTAQDATEVTPWCKEEIKLLGTNPRFKVFISSI